MIHQFVFSRVGILVIFLTIHISVFASKANEPIITLQPLSVPVCYGGNTSISAIATNADYYILEKLNGATWETVSGATYLGGNTLTFAFNNVISADSYRITFTNSAGVNSTISNTFTINALRPNITTQPIDQNDCDGLSVSFRVVATGTATLTYQWQRKKPTDADFINITPLGATLSISNIGSSTNPHLSQYRCIVTDGNGCTNTSSVATLTTNKILSANDPTLCSGASTVLSTTLRGTPTAYQWQKKIGSTFTNLSETADIVGVTSASLQLKNVLLTDNAADYRCKVTFQAGASTCIYTPSILAEQNRLTVNATPAVPTATSAERCGAGSLLLSASGATTGQDYKWYADTTQAPIQVGGASFATPSLATSTDYFVGIYQTSTLCESYKRKVSAIIKEIPTINLGTISAICPSDLVFSLPYSQTTASPNKFSVSSSDLANFKNIVDSNLVASPILISLPTTKSSGEYTFKVNVLNSLTACKSIDYITSLRVRNNTVITKQPTPKSVCEGGATTFTVEATGEGTMYFQWRKDGEFIDGETSSSLNITNISATNVGSYDCIVTSDCGIATSAAALLSMNLYIATQPQNQTVCEGKGATFSVSAIGSGTLTYQWKKNGANIGSNSATLVLLNSQVADNQSIIACEITAACGNITSNEAILTVNPKPNLPSIVSPLGYCQNAVAGILSAVATTGNTLVWYGNDAIGGTPSSSPPSISTSAAGTFYFYVVQKDANNCESARAAIEVNITPSLIANLGLSPDKICATGLLNKEALLTAVASGGNGVYSYEWTKNLSTILGESASTYVANEAATYSVKVSSGNCIVEKSASITSILPELSVLPICNDTILCGVNAGTLTATSTLSGGNFRWYDDATSSSVLSLSNPVTISGLSATKTYYVSYSKTLNSITCETPRKAVLVEVKTSPTAPIITGTSSVCVGEKAILQASACTGGQIIWSTGESGTSIEVSPIVQTSYKVKCKVGTCESLDSEMFTVSIKPKPSIDLATITSICNAANSFQISYSNAANSPDKYSLTSSMPSFVNITDADLTASPINVIIANGNAGVHTFSLKLKSVVSSCESVQNFTITVLNKVVGGAIKTTSSIIFCAGYNPTVLSNVTLASGGKTPYQYQWEFSSDGINYSEIFGATNSTYDPAGLSATSYFRRKVLDACNEIAYSNVHQISIVPDPVVSITTTKTVVCSGESIVLNETITEAGTGVCNTIWQSSASASMTSVVEEGQGNSLTISYVNTSASVLKKYLRAKYDCAASTCNLAYSNIIELDILPIPQAPTISGVSKICSGSSTILKSSACPNGIVKWNTGEEKDSITVSTAGTYWAVCKNAACESVKSNEILVEVSGVLSPPIISGTSSICLGDSAILTASNCTGTILWSNGQTGASIKVSPSTTTSYTARCQNEICTSAESDAFTVSIKAAPSITISAINALCSSATSFEIVYSNAQNSPSLYSLTSTMPNFVSIGETVLLASPISVNIPSGKVGVHTFNLKLKGECENIQTFSVEILPNLTSGAIKATSATIYCAGYNPATISSESLASGGKSPYQYQWEVSSDGINYTEIAGATSSTYDPAGLSSTTYYRRKVIDGCNEIAYSNTHQISIVPDPVVSITANKTVVCSGENIVLNETITEAGTGVCSTIWQSSNSVSMTSLVEEGQGNSLTISYVNTTASVLKKYLRAKYDCAASTCNLAYSNIIEVEILPIPLATVINGESKICEGSSTILKSSACSNGIIKWNTGEEKDSITVSTAGAYWAVCKNAACESVKSNEILVEVSGVLSPPIISGTSSICLRDSATLTASNCTGTILWSNGQTGASIKVSPSTATSYTARCQSPICISAESNSVSITILPKPIITTQPKNDGDCKGNGVNLDVVASNTSTYQWQIRQVGGIFENISGANAARLAISSVGTSPYLDQTQYRVLLSNATCSTISDSATLTVNSITGQIPDQTICEGAADSVLFNLNNLTFTGQIKSYQWQKQSGSSWLDLSGKNTNSLLVRPLVAADAGAYRCKITFYAGSSTCIRYSTEDDANGAILTIIGSQKPTISGANLVCYGKSTTLTAANCTDGILTWSNGNTGNSTSISPLSDTKYTVSCQNTSCGTMMVSDTFAVVVQNTPKPINTTPNNAILPNTITFSATGIGLKWYASATTSTVLATAPTVSNAGTYTYWVSQTINGCESERLAITAHIYTNLAITQQPTDQYDCKGNGVNFPILVEGTGSILYKWQRKLPNESTFTDLVAGNGISGELTNNLKISGVGNEFNPNLSQFRCIIQDSLNSLTSDIVTLYVNSVIGSLPNQGLCKGKNFVVNLNTFFEITGEIDTYQWQTRQGTSGAWTDLTDAGRIGGSLTNQLTISNINELDVAYYRCSVKFKTGNISCVESTDPMKLFVSDYPASPSVNSPIKYCQYDKSAKLGAILNNSTNDAMWYSAAVSEGTIDRPLPSTAESGTQTFYVSERTPEGCESPKIQLEVIVNPQPNAPTNSTPESIEQGNVLSFSATGTRLKWYTSRTGRTFTTEAPIFTNAGTYTRYVSQTSDAGCESPRIMIVATITPVLSISKQPISQADCDGNSVTFSITAKSNLAISYQWQKKLPSDSSFVNMQGDTAKSLTISKIGDVLNPDGTLYRCIIKDEKLTLISEFARLTVNAITGKLTDFVGCLGQDLSLQLNNINTTGNIKYYEWQQEIDKKWQTIDTTQAPILPLGKADSSKIGKYRVKIVFGIDAKNTCSRYTNDAKVQIHEVPSALIINDLSVCQNQLLNSFSELKSDENNTINWFSSLTDTSKNKQNLFKNAGKITVFLSQENEFTCQSERKAVNLTIKPSPQKPLTDSLLTFCQFSPAQELSASSPVGILWYQQASGGVGTAESPMLDVSQDTLISYFVSAIDTNTCESERVRVLIDIKPCISQEIYPCQTLSLENVKGRNWFYFIDNHSNIYAAIYPNGNNLGKVSLQTKHYENIPKTTFGTALMARYFNFESSLLNTFDKAVSIKIFYTFQEFDAYRKTIDEANVSIKNLNLVHYDGIFEDCGFENNDNLKSGESKVIYKNIKADSLNSTSFYLQFDVNSFSEIGTTSNIFANLSQFSAEKESENVKIKWKLQKAIRVNKFVLQRSIDQKNWATIGEVAANQTLTEYEFFDHLPLSGKNYYRLVAIDQDGTKKYLDPVLVNFSDQKPVCKVFPNPVVATEAIQLYLRNIQVADIQLYNILGQSISIETKKDALGFYQIRPDVSLSQGIYYLITIDKNEQRCVQKIVFEP